MTFDDLLNKFLLGDVMEKMALIPDESVHCIITSPPYYAVRDYGIEPSNWPEINFSIIEKNPASIEIAERIAYKELGAFR